ncbi:ribonuclease 3-like protein 2 [Andrographis paniculata]|uniref:ribonuclease 3-like protein 2 n=1 Tax=Andrographis paniculata TaxID=175694 RepID=UPI0021E82AFB|nr:ribonuclease 3-like protein 2 [Andrographis paniculata]
MDAAPVGFSALPSGEPDDVQNFEASVAAVERLIKYQFRDRRRLEDALTHPSYTDSSSYQRLEFVGDAALGLAISNLVFLQYPDADPGKLSLVRAANISTEKLARVAVRHQFYKYVRHNAAVLDEKVRDFLAAIEEEDGTECYGGLVKAPKVLADIVESIAAAVYVDSGFDLKLMWKIIGGFLEPLVMLDALEHQPQPVTMLYELCQKAGKQIDIKHWRKEDRNIASVYVDGEFIASASSEQKENAKLHAAKAALEKLSPETTEIDILSELNGNEIGAKHKLHELCGKRKWPKPIYKLQEEGGLAHNKRFKCSVEIEVDEGILFVKGEDKARLKAAENSAAFLMLHGLKERNYI